MFKNMKVVMFFDNLINPSFKMKTRFANIARTTVRQVNLYTRKDFKSWEIESLYEK